MAAKPKPKQKTVNISLIYKELPQTTLNDPTNYEVADALYVVKFTDANEEDVYHGAIVFNDKIIDSNNTVPVCIFVKSTEYALLPIFNPDAVPQEANDESCEIRGDKPDDKEDQDDDTIQVLSPKNSSHTGGAPVAHTATHNSCEQHPNAGLDQNFVLRLLALSQKPELGEYLFDVD
jgi:hypothetical protein